MLIGGGSVRNGFKSEMSCLESFGVEGIGMFGLMYSSVGGETTQGNFYAAHRCPRETSKIGSYYF